MITINVYLIKEPTSLYKCISLQFDEKGWDFSSAVNDIREAFKNIDKHNPILILNNYDRSYFINIKDIAYLEIIKEKKEEE